MCGIRDVVPAVPSDSCHFLPMIYWAKTRQESFYGGGRGLGFIFLRLVRPFDVKEIAEHVLQNRNSL